MATFEAKVYKLTIEPHPNADKLELAVVGDYRAIVGKGLYKTGDLGVYIQEASLVPKWLCEKYDWKLAGPDTNRVKAMKLRGILSQGIVVPVSTTHRALDGIDYPTPPGVQYDAEGSLLSVVEGQDVAAELGIVKYEPPIPVHMAGEVTNAFGYTLSYDIENIKKFPDIIEQDELVIMTEKLHGTWTCFGYNPNFGDIVTSKGMSGQGLVFKLDAEANKDNLYVRALRGTEFGVEVGFDEDAFEDVIETQNVIERMYRLTSGMESFYILGETYGKGVQDLTYGTTKPEFRAFDIYLGEPGKGRYLPAAKFFECCKSLSIDTVPVLYMGPYSKEKLVEVTNGTETLSGKGTNIREGVVVKPVMERRHELIGRVQLKSVSDAYLLRKGEVTELT